MRKLFGYLFFVIAVTALAWVNLATAVVAICATMLAAPYSNADSLIEISFGPLKAKLEREISDAEKLLGKLRSLAATQARISIGASARTGRWPGPENWQFHNLRKIEAALRDIGATDIEIRETRQELTNFFLVDLGDAATGSSLIPVNLPQQAQQELSDIKSRGEISDPNTLEDWLSRWKQLTPERGQLIGDMRWVIANQDIKNEDQFARRNLNFPW